MILVTGANGFVGSAVLKALALNDFSARGAIRASTLEKAEHELISVGEINAHTDWSHALCRVDVVIHCAARAHVMNEDSADAIAAYRSVNVEGTRRLAEQAAAAGVRRLVFLSSIKVNGESTDGLPRPLGARNDESGTDGSPRGYAPHDDEGKGSSRNDEGGLDAPVPEDAYGRSKLEAEQALWGVSVRTGLEVVVVRPPLVYGPGVKGNLARLLTMVRRGVPLPLASVDNRRSLIGLDNLVDLLIRCVDHPRAAGQTLLVSDGEDLSTPDLIRRMASAMEKKAFLFPMPVSMLRFAGRLTGRGDEVERIVGSLQIDSTQTRALLDWTPPLSVDEGLQKMVAGL